ncbi:uncharacterized protein MELLADRAFT_73188 [Melampsora larici-populina 98AG31]|uniref:Large ribosomal subunit protein uL3m n=1 Tax=Melampsora larici-populina (strain 98AG31 / pathotype 3-4-7) TaxID=747676 RepID=F4S4Q3_MELLP|nr:uncharacterized protein MELLADRAFT_73188 [Melampsora larici-populina 98AG31]EGG00388.1 hypothetical protein MELLADRAFT_73188 [Melampsora larici-populina 98AG31]
MTSLQRCRLSLHSLGPTNASSLFNLFRSFSISASSANSNTQTETAAEPSQSSELVLPKWTPGIRRTGVIARKRGMTSFWDADGVRVPVTVLELEDVQVIGHKYHARDSYCAVQVGCSNRNTRNNLNSSQRKWFEHAGVNPKHRVAEFQVTDETSLVPVGTEISSAHFVPGQFVDVKANSKGKGFAGVMKRWGFSGGNASHGSTKHHRKAGSTGQHQDPGRVWPGKKMAGRMGNQPITVRNLLVARIDTALNVVYVKGQVPGPTKGYVKISDAEKGVHRVGQHWIRKGWTGRKEEGEAGSWVLPGRIKSLPFPTIDRQVASECLPEQVSFLGERRLK